MTTEDQLLKMKEIIVKQDKRIKALEAFVDDIKGFHHYMSEKNK